jgi:hypothetical protein
MITYGDVQFEQPQPKIWYQGKHAVALLYGDMTVQAEVAMESERTVLENAISDVGEIAAVYSDHLRQHVAISAERAILSPLGLSFDNFSSAANLAESLAKQLQDYYYTSGTSTNLGGAIIAGADARGGHILKVEYDKVSRCDGVGFVAAGSGQWHAESQFMFYRYTKGWDFPEAISIVYSAKKRAEVAPGVGQETDLVLIQTAPPAVFHLKSDSILIGKLEEFYKELKGKHQAADAELLKGVRELITSALVPPPKQGDKKEKEETQAPSAAEEPFVK